MHPLRCFSRVCSAKPTNNWSEREDLNLRPLVSQTSALTGLRHAPNVVPIARIAGLRKARSHHFGFWCLCRKAPELPQSRGDPASGVLQRLIQHFAAGDEFGEHPSEALPVDGAGACGRGGGAALAEGGEDFLVVGLGEAEVDALLLLTLVIVVVTIAGAADAGLLLGLHQAGADGVLDSPERDRGRAVGEALHRFDAVLLEDPLHAADGVALAVEETADTLEQVDVVGAIIAAAAAALHRLDLGETRLPEPQHVLRNVEFLRYFADGSERIRRLVQMPNPYPEGGLRLGLRLAGVAIGAVPGVDPLLQDRRRLEHHDPAGRDRHLGAGLGVATDALTLLADHEGAERGQLHRLAFLKAIGDLLQHEFHEGRRFRARQPYLLVDGFAQIDTRYGFTLIGHRPAPHHGEQLLSEIMSLRYGGQQRSSMQAHR